VKFERTDSFKADWHGLSDIERDLFRTVVKDFHAAAERHAEEPNFGWPASLRVKKAVNAPRVGDDVVVLRTRWSRDIRMGRDRRSAGYPVEKNRDPSHLPATLTTTGSAGRAPP